VTPPRKLFVNLADRDLDKTKEIFPALGYTYNPQFTDDKAACMVLSDGRS
jgi:predicted lactoylglutathione lyase